MFAVPGFVTTEQLYESESSLIYRAVESSTKRLVILKVLRDIEATPEAIAKFKLEYLLTKRLSNPGIIEVHDYLRVGNHWLMVEEDFGAESLRRLALAGSIRLERFFEIAISIAEILSTIHDQRVIHKDVNPSNIVLNLASGEVKLIDFGISSDGLSTETVGFEHPTRLEGTLAYVSPEQTGRLNLPLDHRSDLYSLGCTFYELLTGHLPFPSTAVMELIHGHLARDPVNPRLHRNEIPRALAAVVLKLMAKDPDARYQSAHGLKVDLELCAQQDPAAVTLNPIELGRGDVTSFFRVPARLYGRRKELERLTQGLDDACEGKSRFLLVTGAAGVGKSALVKELYRPITLRQGALGTGKFQQFERNVPYAAIIDALHELVSGLLCEGEDVIAQMREELLHAVGWGCSVVIEAIPQLELVTGPFPRVASPTPGDYHLGFTRAVLGLIRLFARDGRPVVLFLDDLQWADSPSLSVLEELICSDDVPHLLVIGSHRDDEVGEGHPLRLMLRGTTNVERIHLTPLVDDDISRLLVDTCRVSSEEATPLASVVRAKTGGNPLFLRRFLSSLLADELMCFEHSSGSWRWNLAEIQARDVSDNVVEMLVGELRRLPAHTQSLLEYAACLGNRFDLGAMVLASGRRAHEITKDLGPAVLKSMVIPLSNDFRLFETRVAGLEPTEIEYKFSHDRIQQAAYALMSREERRQLHLKIGRNLWERRERAPLVVLGQLDVVSDLIDAPAERLELAELNLHAATKARESAAYDAALRLLCHGLDFLQPIAPPQGERTIALPNSTTYEEHYDLTLELTARAADAAFLAGDFDTMKQLVDNVLAHARSPADCIEIHQISINALTAQSRLIEALDVAVGFLARLGVEIPREPSLADIDAAIQEVESACQGRDLKQLVARPPANTSLPHRGALRILDSIHPTTVIARQGLGPIVAAKMVLLTVLNGRTENSTNGFTYYGIQLCGQDAIEEGYRFGLLARAACATDQDASQLAELNSSGYYFMFHWKEHIRELISKMEQGYRAGLDAGRIAGAVNCFANFTCSAPFIAGYELTGLDEQMRQSVKVCEQLKQGPYVVWLRIYWQCLLNLVHEQADPCVLAGDAYDERSSLPVHMENEDDLTIQLVYLMKIMLCCRFGRYRDAIRHYREHVEGKYPRSGVLLPPTVMYYALALLAECSRASAGERELLLTSAREELVRLERWAGYGPMNYLHKYYLVAAELAAVEGKDALARDHYDAAIDLAREHEYLNEESLALERAALFFRSRGLERLAGYYLRDALYAYQRWGAGAKLIEFRRLYPDLLATRDIVGREIPRHRSHRSPAGHQEVLVDEAMHRIQGTGEFEELDLAAVLRASRAISGEHDPSRLLETVISVCLEYAGAETCALLLDLDDRLVIKARGHVRGGAPAVELCSVALNDQVGVSVAVIHYVANTSESVVLSDAATEGRFTGDSHIRDTPSRSVLCVPILYQGTFVGISYMENNRTTGAFEEGHLEVLGLLMAQAAMSIENVRLRRMDVDTDFEFTVGGSLTRTTASYVERNADMELMRRVRHGRSCYVVDARQMGKSSLRVRTMDRLAKEGVRCVAVDLMAIGSRGITPEQWHAGIAYRLVSELGLGDDFRLLPWWKERSALSSVQRLTSLIDEVVLARVPQRIVVFLDEIEMALDLPVGIGDLLGSIRALHEARAIDPRFGRLSFVLLGVLPIERVRDSAPFNIGEVIRLAGFRYHEARVLEHGLMTFDSPDVLLKEILRWTGGQPFLTQKLCKLAHGASSRPGQGQERSWVSDLVRDRVINGWRAHDEPEHLRTIEARLLRSPRSRRLLERYAEVYERVVVAPSDDGVDAELRLCGVVAPVERGDPRASLRISNPIYASVFDLEWIGEALAATGKGGER